MKNYILLFLKGMAMGAANVIPGVSGGTIALITGIYEELIDSIKSFDVEAIRLLLKFDIKGLIKHVNLWFLASIFLGIAVSILSLAKLLEYLLQNQEMLVMAFFFGLILLSVFYVGKTVKRWNAGPVIMLILGTVIAVSISLLTPASENAAFFYVFICGIVAICSMILPGLSGSFILLIMGNYLLVMGAVSNLQIDILIPLALGCGFGLVAFSQLLSWVFKNYHDLTVALMTGFVLGSLSIIWPWKETLFLTDSTGAFILKDEGEKIVSGYEWHLPDFGTTETWYAVGLIILGCVVIWGIEKLGTIGSEKAA